MQEVALAASEHTAPNQISNEDLKWKTRSQLDSERRRKGPGQVADHLGLSRRAHGWRQVDIPAGKPHGDQALAPRQRASLMTSKRESHDVGTEGGKENLRRGAKKKSLKAEQVTLLGN